MPGMLVRHAGQGAVAGGRMSVKEVVIRIEQQDDLMILSRALQIGADMLSTEIESNRKKLQEFCNQVVKPGPARKLIIENVERGIKEQDVELIKLSNWIRQIGKLMRIPLELWHTPTVL